MPVTARMPRILPGQGTVEIPLTRDKVAIIDIDDAAKVLRHAWCACKDHHTWYAVTAARRDGKDVNLRMHRLILEPPSGVDIGHVNGDGLDNRRSNLRVATCSQNAQNMRTPAHNKCGLKGVHWHKRNRKWIAHITLNKRARHLGCFETKEAAAYAYDQGRPSAFRAIREGERSATEWEGNRRLSHDYSSLRYTPAMAAPVATLPSRRLAA